MADEDDYDVLGSDEPRWTREVRRDPTMPRSDLDATVEAPSGGTVVARFLPQRPFRCDGVAAATLVTAGDVVPLQAWHVTSFLVGLSEQLMTDDPPIGLELTLAKLNEAHPLVVQSVNPGAEIRIKLENRSNRRGSVSLRLLGLELP